MILTAIYILVCLVLIYANAILVHEIGHKRALEKIIGRKVITTFSWKGFSVGTPEDYTTLRRQQYIDVLKAGIISGLATLIILLMFSPPEIQISTLPLIALYLWGCKKDIKNILEQRRLEKNDLQTMRQMSETNSGTTTTQSGKTNSNGNTPTSNTPVLSTVHRKRKPKQKLNNKEAQQ